MQFQVREIVYSIFQWEDGQFHFEESSLPEKERITVDLDVAEPDPGRGAPRRRQRGACQGRYPEGTLVLETVQAPAPAGLLEPYESHVLELVDGERSVLEICRESEIGDNET